MTTHNFEKFIPPARKAGVGARIRSLDVGGIFAIERRARRTDRLPNIKTILRRLLATGKEYSISVDEFEIAVRRDK